MDGNWVDAAALRQVRTPFVIVGGVATTLYMPRRLTQDLDIPVIVSDAAPLYRELEAWARRG